MFQVFLNEGWTDIKRNKQYSTANVFYEMLGWNPWLWQPHIAEGWGIVFAILNKQNAYKAMQKHLLCIMLGSVKWNEDKIAIILKRVK